MSRQFRLELQHPPSYRAEDFIVSPANAQAVRALEAWPAWHGGVLALFGPEGSGKTHLARIWLERSGGTELPAAARLDDLEAHRGHPILLEHADRASSETLFHLINMAAAEGGGLLLTARTAPVLWPCTLPDLRSRLNALETAEIEPPDDELLEGILNKFFRERNIRPADDVFPYLIRRMERSVPVALALVERLDAMADAEQRPVTRALARQIIEAGADSHDLFDGPLANPASSGEKDE